MGRGEHGESSSSQNDSISIVSIQRGAGGKEFCLLSEGSSFLLPPGFAKAHNLSPGMVLSPRDAESLKYRSLYVLVKRKALEFLAAREYSTFALRQKLVLKDFDEDVISDVLDDLTEEGSLSDERFCKLWIESRLRRHPEGITRLYYGLRKAGISESMAARIIAVEATEEVLKEALFRAGEKIMRNSSLTEEKIIKKLIYLGFPYNDVIQYVKGIH